MKELIMLPSMSLIIAAAVAAAFQLAACLISAIQLFMHQKEMQDYTRVFLGGCAIWFVLDCLNKVIYLIASPDANLFTEMMHPNVVILGLMSMIMALVYPLCVMKPKNYVPLILMFLPWLVLAAIFFYTPAWTQLYSLEDLQARIGDFNVILRLVAIGLFVPYLVYLCILLLRGHVHNRTEYGSYFIVFVFSTLLIAALHFLFFFTGNLMYQIVRDFLLGCFFYSIVLFDIEVRLFPKKRMAGEEEQAAMSATPGSALVFKSMGSIARRPLWERICYVLDKEEAWRNPNLSVEGMASLCGSNVPYVINCIKRETGYSANEYINRKRISYVCKLLAENPERNLQEVFFEAGYRVRTTAWRNFCEIMGVSPSEYRFSRR